ncbi:hypothetical protein BLX87_12700 [Bacillus sp. VT-16-64]|nr:hypothetical protein BLX87_12700 [Bacillus sp. VT-16-64]
MGEQRVMADRRSGSNTCRRGLFNERPGREGLCGWKIQFCFAGRNEQVGIYVLFLENLAPPSGFLRFMF